MSGFSVEWLAMREAADKAARSGEVLNAARKAFVDRTDANLVICDLGSGTGASVDAFSGLFPTPQTWCLVDTDGENLERAIERYSGNGAIDGVVLETKFHDLSDDPAPWSAKTNLVTATAFFDLTSRDWLHEFGNCICADRLSLLATLTYDGRHILEPELPLDAVMLAAFNRHQKTDKGFGPAAGADATTALLATLTDHDYEITLADSSWRLDGIRDRILIHTILDGWVTAVRELELVPKGDARAWHDRRKINTKTLQVGHHDFFAKPRSQDI